MDGSMFRGIGQAIEMLLISFLVCLPLAVWKVIDIIVWIYQHVEIGIK